MRIQINSAPSMPLVFSYGLAIAFVSLALLASLALRHPFGNPFWFFFSVAVILSTWFGRSGAGWVAVVCSGLLVIYFFTPPFRSFAMKASDLPYFLAFVGCEVGVAQIISWRKRADNDLRRAHDELERRVAERTAELKDAHDTLVQQIAEQRRTEESLQVARTELARAARITTIGELTASIAHEVNQPLAAVVANADACVAWLSGEHPNLVEARCAAEQVAQGATRTSEVVARIRSLITKATHEQSTVQINQMIEQTIALAAAQASANNVTIGLELSPDLPHVLGDSIQLQQVVVNLVMNGIDAMICTTDRPRRVVISSEPQSNGQILVSVQDSGIGVNSEVMNRLFEPFFTTRPNGMGLGLSISRSIIEAHGGRLWAESNGSTGSVFYFTLPGELSV